MHEPPCPLTKAGPQASPPPPPSPLPLELPFELILSILATAVRHLRPKRSVDASKVAAVLNTVPRSSAPELSYAAIMVMPWIDTNVACRIGNLWLLDTLHHRLNQPPFTRPLQYTSLASLRAATENGHLHVLRWWVNNMGRFHGYANMFLCLASEKGDMDMLNWWIAESGAKYERGDIGPMNRAPSPKVLDWWVNQSGLQLVPEVRGHGDFNWEPLVKAAYEGRLDVVNWWIMESSLKLPSFYFEIAIIGAVLGHGQGTASGNLGKCTLLVERLHVHWQLAVSEEDALRCCSRAPASPDHYATMACYTGDLEWIQWCLDHLGCKIYGSLAYTLASAGGHLHVLDWLKSEGHRPDDVTMPHGMLRGCSNRLGCLWSVLERLLWHSRKNQIPTMSKWPSGQVSPIDMASSQGHAHVLDWWEASGFAMPLYTIMAVSLASANGHIAVLDWWKRRAATMDLRYDIGAVWEATRGAHIAVLDWWLSQPELVEKLDLHNRNVIHSIAWMTRIARNIRLMEWWCSQLTGLDKDVFVEEMWIAASRSVWLEVMDLLWKAGLRPTALHEKALYCSVSTAQMFDVLHWWEDHAPELLVSFEPSSQEYLGRAIDHGDTLYLEACIKLGLLHGRLDVEKCSAIATLDWAKRSKDVYIECTPETLYEAVRWERLEVLQWWKSSGLVTQVPDDLLYHDKEFMDWDCATVQWLRKIGWVQD